MFHIFSQRTALGHTPRTGAKLLARFQALDLLKSLERANVPPSSHALAAVLGEVAEVPEVEVRDSPNIDLDAAKVVILIWMLQKWWFIGDMNKTYRDSGNKLDLVHRAVTGCHWNDG